MLRFYYCTYRIEYNIPLARAGRRRLHQFPEKKHADTESRSTTEVYRDLFCLADICQFLIPFYMYFSKRLFRLRKKYYSFVFFISLCCNYPSRSRDLYVKYSGFGLTYILFSIHP
jgi:hypothetical protein